MVEKPSKLQPVLIGGLVMGLGSVIPGLSLGNLCCCGWAIVGGALAVSLLIRRSPVIPITSGEGAKTGALAAVVGALINLVIGVPLSLLRWNSLVAQIGERADNTADAASREAMKQIISVMQGHPALIALGMWFVFGLVSVGAAALGGVIGVAMFEKRKGQQLPPPGGFSPDYGPASNINPEG